MSEQWSGDVRAMPKQYLGSHRAVSGQRPGSVRVITQQRPRHHPRIFRRNCRATAAKLPSRVLAASGQLPVDAPGNDRDMADEVSTTTREMVRIISGVTSKGDR